MSRTAYRMHRALPPRFTAMTASQSAALSARTGAIRADPRAVQQPIDAAMPDLDRLKGSGQVILAGNVGVEK